MGRLEPSIVTATCSQKLYDFLNVSRPVGTHQDHLVSAQAPEHPGEVDMASLCVCWHIVTTAISG